VPIYQRNYTWGADKEVKKLIDDIIEFGQEYQDNDRAEYYIGNIIIKNQTRGMITERIIIDGQQRITTSVLILCAIRDIYRDKYPSNDNNNIYQFFNFLVCSPCIVPLINRHMKLCQISRD
jgi:uncharacterized protein with ParB-like and HNH nuclease domain